MSFKEFIQTKESSNNFLPHTEEDDKYHTATMRSFYYTDLVKIYGTNGGTRHVPNDLGKIGNLNVVVTNWPLVFNNHFYFKNYNDDLVGFAIVRRGGRSPNGDETWFGVTMIYLLPPYRKQGFGTAFYQFLLSHNIELKPDRKQSEAGAALWNKLKTPKP